MAFSFVLSTQNGFFRRKDLLFPDILFSILCGFLLVLGSGGSLFLLVPVLFGFVLGALAYFLLAGQKSYPLYWLNHTLGFAILIPRDSRYTLHILFAMVFGLGLWWVGERQIRVRLPLALVQFLLFLIFYLIPGIESWSGNPGLVFRNPYDPDLYTRGFVTEILPGFRYSALEVSGGFGIVLLLPLFLKRGLAVLLPLAFGCLLSFWFYLFQIPGAGAVSGSVWNAGLALLLLLNLPGRNTGTLLPLSFFALLPIGLAIFFIPAAGVPIFLWVVLFFFIESILIRIFLGDRIEKHESAPRFT